MKFGAREICDVVLKATVEGQTIGDYKYSKGQPIMYFDSLKTSSMEQASTPVYAQGGKGNARLVSWDGDKTITFVMEDALLSPISLAILAKAGFTQVKSENEVYTHVQERVVVKSVTSSEEPEIDGQANEELKLLLSKNPVTEMDIWFAKVTDGEGDDFIEMTHLTTDSITNNDISEAVGSLKKGDTYFVDYYCSTPVNSTVITIEPENFEGNFYLEASTLFRDKAGRDLPAEFIIPNCKPQSAMTFAMASSGDPSTFTFTMDAFPGYTKYDSTKKVLAAIQIIEESESTVDDKLDGFTQF